MGIELLKQNFTLIHVVLVCTLFFLGFRFLYSRNTKSNFKVREYDKHSGIRTLDAYKPKPKVKATPARFSPNSEAHVILGVPENASQRQIQKAYRALMKRYHPDKTLGFEKVTAQINEAKEEMMKRFKS
ncbi:MAG: J domain-containing protein [Xanthomonadaceae bacterium]|nr:J domain-containing protein [Xanthomonadaceae bacterium]